MIKYLQANMHIILFGVSVILFSSIGQLSCDTHNGYYVDIPEKVLEKRVSFNGSS
jgi:hypothetical protein